MSIGTREDRYPRRGDRGGGDAESAYQRVRRERLELLAHLNALLERPMLVLSFVWLVLVLLELVGYSRRWTEDLSWAIWGVFVLHFLLGFTVAPHKGRFLRRNWLTALALFLPALRLLRVARLVRALRAARAVRGMRFVKVISSANRGLRTARHVLARRGLPFVLSGYALVLLLGAAGMYAFERGAPGGGFPDYGQALWWTAMLLTTLGGSYEPLTTEGRLLTWLLAVFAFTVFGYATATLASLFIAQDAGAKRSDPDGAATGRGDDVAALREEIRGLREELRSLAKGRASDEVPRA